MEAHIKDLHFNPEYGLISIVGPMLGLIDDTYVLSLDGEILGRAGKHAPFPHGESVRVVEVRCLGICLLALSSLVSHLLRIILVYVDLAFTFFHTRTEESSISLISPLSIYRKFFVRKSIRISCSR